MNKLLYQLSAKLPCRLIKLDSGPYLERYYLGQLFGVTFYLHRFVSSDTERHMHNHPWGWGRAIVLSGSYLEESVVDLCPHAGDSGCITRIKKIRWWNRVDGNWLHRISDAAPGTWTLFFHGRRVEVAAIVQGEPVYSPKGWGFLNIGTSIISRQAITSFTPYISTHNLEWWRHAALGEGIGREPLFDTSNHVARIVAGALAIGCIFTAAIASITGGAV